MSGRILVGDGANVCAIIGWKNTYLLYDKSACRVRDEDNWPLVSNLAQISDRPTHEKDCTLPSSSLLLANCISNKRSPATSAIPVTTAGPLAAKVAL
jgi:hypothetical protein